MRTSFVRDSSVEALEAGYIDATIIGIREEAIDVHVDFKYPLNVSIGEYLDQMEIQID